MEMEMQQLLSMGFPDDLAAQALAATGGTIAEATDWILTHNTHSNPTLNPSPTSTTTTTDPSTPFQPKLDRFFQFQSKPSTQSTPPKTQLNKPQEPTHHHSNEPRDDPPPPKRPKHHHHHQNPLTPKPNSFPSSSSYSPLTTVENRAPHQPLSERMRPRTVDQIVGQDHLLAATSLLRSAINCNRLFSIVFWGPPGTGKTSIARAIVNSSSSVSSSYRFVALSAVTCGVKDIRDVVDEAKKQRLKHNMRTVLFVDEVHRFNKSQQDSFLPVIEDGSVVFMGATTENPSFHLITPLLSRCRVLTLNPLKPHHVATLLERAAADSDKGLVKSVGMTSIAVDAEAIEFLSENCDGDGRVALNALEVSSATAVARLGSVSGDNGGGGGNVVRVTLDDAKEALQCKHLAYDKAGEEHYNLISALHKSMRGNDANAAIYWLARMLEGGEEPLYIARRLVRFASEDVGLADPSALNQAVACYQACHFLGMPECNVNLAQCVAYLALAPKSIAVYRALGDAQNVVRESVGQNEGVPLHLRNAPTKLMKDVGYGKGYIYTPDNPSAPQTYLPPSLQGYKFLHWPNSTGTDH